jgi:hypothetical protein
MLIEIATRHGLDPLLVQAICQIESGENPWAWNPEPKYRYLWDVRKKAPFRPLTILERMSEEPPADFPTPGGDRDQEWWGQQASWGLMQIMGAVAREYGFKGVFLPQLCDPALGLEYGCRIFAALLRRYSTDVEKALAAYNGGPAGVGRDLPRAYARKVLARYGKLREAAHPTGADRRSD